MNKLEKLYKDILSFAGFEVKDDGELLITMGDRTFPADIDGKLLRFPCKEALNAFDPEKHVIFHPLREFVNRGESDVVRKLRRVINVRLNLATLSLIDGLMTILSNPAMHAKMNPQQRELLKTVDVVDEVLRGKFMSMAPVAFAASPDCLFTNIYTKKAGVYQGTRHARVGIVNFPILSDRPEAFAKLKPADWEKIKQVITFIFPDLTGEEFNSFSDHVDCPWIDCLLRTSANVAGRINELWGIYEKFIVDEANVIRFDMDWVDDFENLAEYKKEIAMIPSQRGNEGERDDANVVDVKPTVSVPVKAFDVPASQPKPAPVPVSAPASTAMAATVQPTAAPAPLWGDAVKPMPVPIMGQPGMHPGMMPSTMPQQAPRPKTDGKVDLDDLVRNNPMVGMPNGFRSPISAAAENAQMMAYQAAMMRSPSMAGMYGMNPGMMAQPGFQPGMGMVDPVAMHNYMLQQQQQQLYQQQMLQPQVDMFGRPLHPGGIQPL